MRIVWKRIAKKRLFEAMEYGIEHFGVTASIRFYSDIQVNVKRLALYPKMGRVEPSLCKNGIVYRSMVVHRHYKIFYCVDEEHEIIYISTLWSTWRNPLKVSKDLESLT